VICNARVPWAFQAVGKMFSGNDDSKLSKGFQPFLDESPAIDEMLPEAAFRKEAQQKPC
jgi:hypothetical protein